MLDNRIENEDLIRELNGLLPKDGEIFFGDRAKKILDKLASDDESTIFDELSDNWES